MMMFDHVRALKFKNTYIQKTIFCVLCVLSGLVASTAMPSLSFWPGMFLGLSGLYVLYAKTKTPIQAFACGFWFAIGYFVSGLWWIGNALLVEGNEFAWVWPISVIGLPTLLGLFTATYLAISRMMASPNTLKGFVCFVLFLAFSEWTRGHAFTGFPWNLYGYTWIEYLPMAQSAYYIGAYGLTILTVFLAGIIGFLFVSNHTIKQKIVFGVLVTFILGAMFVYGQMRLKTNPTSFDQKNSVIVVQPNIPQNMKWDPVAIQENFLKTIRMSKNSLLDKSKIENVFIVWPETAISPRVYTKPENMDSIRQALESYRPIESYLITGVLRQITKEDGDVDFANSVVFLNNKLSSIDVYDKYHLVPFGEFIPFQNWIPIRPVAAFEGFVRGSGAKTVANKDIPPFSPLICYEIIFPGDVVSKKSERPKWIVNVTNDGWYGDSAGPHQHFAQTRLRAIEEGLPVIRSANTGISGVIDPLGRVVEKAGIFEDAVLVSALPSPLNGAPSSVPKGIVLLMLISALVLMIQKLVLHKNKT